MLGISKIPVCHDGENGEKNLISSVIFRNVAGVACGYPHSRFKNLFKIYWGTKRRNYSTVMMMRSRKPHQNLSVSKIH